MGNTQNVGSHSISQQDSKFSLKIATEQAKKIARFKHLDQFYQSIICRIFVQKRQKHLIEIVKKSKDKQAAQQFLNQVHQANIQILDSVMFLLAQFYQHIGKNWFQKFNRKPKGKDKSNGNLISPFDRQIGICGSIDMMNQENWQKISQKYIEIVDLTRRVDKISDYQQYKQKGLQAIKKQEVCFIILAGGKNTRYDLNQHKQCDPLEHLPSNSCLIQIMLKKMQALGRLINTPIHIYIMVDGQQRKNKIRKIKKTKIPQVQYIKVDFLTQINYGCLDSTGKLVVSDSNQVYLHPNGSGDIWGNFQGKNYQKLQLSNYKYFQIFGVSNILQHCFDCYMVGKLISQRLPWVTMATKTKTPKDLDPAIYINQFKQIHVRQPQQIGNGMDHNNLLYFPNGCQHIFLNNTVFSGEFIQKAINSQKWLQHRKYHCKRKFINHRQPLSNYTQIFTFQRQLTDIFAMTSVVYPQISNPSRNINFLQKTCSTVRDYAEKKRINGAVVLMDEQQYNSPFCDKMDKLIGAVSLSQTFKKWLKIKSTQDKQQAKDEEYYQQKLKSICQIDPFISLEGQNLQQTIEQLKKLKGNIEYPLYIGSQSQDVSYETHTQSSMIINKSAKSP